MGARTGTPEVVTMGGVWAFLVGLSVQPPEPTPVRFELQWDAPDACPSGDDVTAAIAEVLGDATAPRQATVQATVRAQAKIEARDDVYALTLQVGEGNREIVGPSCDELAATAAFLVAIAIDPRVLGRPVPTIVTRREPSLTPVVPPPIAETPIPPTRTPAIIPVASTPEPRARTIAIGGRVAAGIGLGPSPRMTGAFAASVGVLGRWFRAEIEGQYWIPRRLASTNNTDVAVVAQLWTIGARGCGVLARGRLEIPLCAVAQAGLIHARGDGDLRSRRARSPWVGIGGGVMAIGWLGERVGIGAGVDVLGSVVAGGFRTEPSGDIDRVGPVAVTALVGLFWRTARPQSKARRPVLETPGAGQPDG